MNKNNPIYIYLSKTKVRVFLDILFQKYRRNVYKLK